MAEEKEDYNRVAVMLCPQAMSVDRFFDRNDPEKQFILNVIKNCDDPEAVMENYRRGLALINGPKHYDELADSGFFTIVRGDMDMVYYDKNGIIIRDLQQSDVQIITDEEIAQGWQATKDKYEMRLKHQAEGKAIALAAEWNGNIAGYINIYPDSKWGAYANRGYAEIVDFGVLEKYRRRGIGSKLMDLAEQIAFSYSDVIYLGVGLHSGYGSAQRMYVKRGYIPDGSGVWYKDQICEPYCDCCNDDDLVLYLLKHKK